MPETWHVFLFFVTLLVVVMLSGLYATATPQQFATPARVPLLLRSANDEQVLRRIWAVAEPCGGRFTLVLTGYLSGKNFLAPYIDSAELKEAAAPSTWQPLSREEFEEMTYVITAYVEDGAITGEEVEHVTVPGFENVRLIRYQFTTKPI